MFSLFSTLICRLDAFFEKIFTIYASFLDRYFLSKKILYVILTRYFEIFSKITNFVLWNDFAYFVFMATLLFTIRYNVTPIHELFLGKISFLDLSLYARSVFCLYLFFISTVLNLTILAYSGQIQHYMKNKYGANILKELHYNSPNASLSKTAISGAVCIAGYVISEVAETIRHNNELDTQAQLERKAREAESQRQEEDRKSWERVAQNCVENKQPIPNFPAR